MVYQDFENDWIEVDDDAKLVAATTKITWTTYERDDHGRFHRDFGVNFFDDFDIVFDIKFDDVEAGDASNRAFIILFQLANAVAGGNDRLRLYAEQQGANDDVWGLSWHQYTGGVLDFAADGVAGAMGLATTYHRLRRSGTTIYWDVYSADALRAVGGVGTGDLDTVDDGGNGSGTDYRYCTVAYGLNAGLDPADHSTGWIDSLDLAYVPPADGAPIGSVASSAVVARVI